MWAIGVLVLSALVSMSMNTVHAFEATTLPGPLALMYGIAPVALAAMQSHAVALRALRKEAVGWFRRGLTFGLVIGGLGLSFLGIYDLLRHAVPDPIPATALHEPAVFFSIVLDLMALAALHELLRESPSLVSAVQAVETTVVPAVPATVVVTPTVAAAEGQRDPSAVSTIVDPSAESAEGSPAVPNPAEGVPPQLSEQSSTTTSLHEDVVAEPVFSDQVQPAPDHDPDAPYYPQALNHFLSDVVVGKPPTVRTIKEVMAVGTDRAARLRAYLGQLVEVAR